MAEKNDLASGIFKIYHYYNYFYHDVYLILSLRDIRIGFENKYVTGICFLLKSRTKEIRLEMFEVIQSKAMLNEILGIEAISIEEYLYEEAMSQAMDFFREKLMYDLYGEEKGFAYSSNKKIKFDEIKKSRLYYLFNNEFKSSLYTINSKLKNTEFSRLYRSVNATDEIITNKIL